MNVLVTHIPHIIPVVAIWGILLRFWLAQRRLARDGDGPAAVAVAASVRPAPPAALPARAVRRSVAARGLLALGPLVGALATGLVIYALNLGARHAGEAAIWAHVGLSLLAMLLVAYKIADIGLARMRASMRGRAAWRATGSLVLLALWIPLLISGVVLLISPGEGSFTAYAHLIASVWWTGLLLWHLRHYLVRATRTVVARPSPIAAAEASPRRPRGRAQAPAGTPGEHGATAPIHGRSQPNTFDAPAGGHEQHHVQATRNNATRHHEAALASRSRGQASRDRTNQDIRATGQIKTKGGSR